jgi:hypothetical protein
MAECPCSPLRLANPAPDEQILELEYFCVGGSPAFFALPGPPFEAKTARKLPELGHSETGSTYTVRLAPVGRLLPDGWKQMRLDLTLPKDRVLQIRNPRIRPERKGEFDVADAAPAAYMKQPRLLFRGKVRPVHLSENGFNSPDYSAKSLEDQAAGMALAWKKMAKLSSIKSWQYHNWIDNRGEGGLKIGLRKYPDDKSDPLGKKPIWLLYKALGTPDEDRACAPYLKTIGIKSWNEGIHSSVIK